MQIKEKPLYLRITYFLIGFVILGIIGSTIIVLLREKAGITLTGVIPNLLIYGVPIVLLGNCLGIWKRGNQDGSNNNHEGK